MYMFIALTRSYSWRPGILRKVPRLWRFTDRNLPFVLVFLSFFIWMGSVHAGDTVILDADNLFTYAEACFARKDYETAIVEYKRFLNFFPEDERVEKAMFAMAMAEYQREHFKEAIAAFSETENRFSDTPLAVRSVFMISRCYLGLKDIGNAIITLNNLLAQTDDVDIRDEACQALGWIYIGQGDFEKARSCFQKISLKNQPAYQTDRVMGELEKDVVIPRKNPQVAGFLSIVPGGGYLYCGRYRDALVSFLLNGALILASYSAFDQGNSALGGVIAAVEFGFYAGNIYGGIASAHKYNHRKTQDFIESLKEKARVGVVGTPGGMQFTVEIPF